MSIAFKSDVSADDNTLPIWGPDENLMLGTSYKGNFADTTYAWPAGASMVNGQAVGNAMPGKAAATLVLGTTPAMTRTTKGFLLAAVASTVFERIVIEPQGGSLDVNLTNNKIVWGWMTLPAADPGGISAGYLMSKMTGFSNASPGINFSLSSYANRSFSIKFGNTNGADITWVAPIVPQGVHLWAIARMTYAGDPIIADGTYIELWLDAICVQRVLTTSALTAIANDLSFGRPNLGTGAWTSVPGTTFFGGGVEDLTISARSSQQQQQAEYELYAGTWG